jgi:hypothetical protein
MPSIRLPSSRLPMRYRSYLLLEDLLSGGLCRELSDMVARLLERHDTPKPHDLVALSAD